MTAMDRRTALKTLGWGGLVVSPLGSVACTRSAPITVPGNRSFEHPETEADIVALVRAARDRGVQLRVRGSLHSVGGAIFTDDGPDHVNVQLDRYNQIVSWDERNLRVTVQAGMHLGVDPQDRDSNKGNSLLYALEKKGWALPDLGGISHQTVGGFLSTGSAGGTVHHDVGEAIVSMRIVAGNGRVYELEPDPDDPEDESKNPFFGACVSMGLYGVISTVTFQCVPRYDIIGKQVTCKYVDSPVDLFGAKEGGLERWMEESVYNRVLFWPQRHVQKVQLWSARRTTPEDAPKTHEHGKFVAKRPSKVQLQGLANKIYTFVEQTKPPYSPLQMNVAETAINTFITKKVEEFWGPWHELLPMDNGVSDTYLPTEFTELFVDIGQTAKVMKDLEVFWSYDTGMKRTGPFSTEVYPSKASRFWMSPSYGANKVRIDVFWFKNKHQNPDTFFYPQYWDMLSRYRFRFHWGKHLSAGQSATGTSYRAAQNPRWETFLRWRNYFDPDQVFVTNYWREHLGICWC